MFKKRSQQTIPSTADWRQLYAFLGVLVFGAIALALHANVAVIAAISGALSTLYTAWWICSRG